MAQQTAQRRLYEAFRDRPLGMLNDEALLGSIAMILRLEYGFCVSLESRNDLLVLTDEQAEAALEHVHSVDIPRDSGLALALVAAEHRRTGT